MEEKETCHIKPNKKTVVCKTMSFNLNDTQRVELEKANSSSIYWQICCVHNIILFLDDCSSLYYPSQTSQTLLVKFYISSGVSKPACTDLDWKLLNS